MSGDSETVLELQKGLAGLPKIYIGTPWPIPYISTGFCHSLRNMLVPFPYVFECVKSRFLADARNAIVEQAIVRNFDYVMQIDADQQFPPDFFIRLWRGIQEYGDNAVLTGWSICKAGRYEGQPSVYRVRDADVHAISIAELSRRRGFIEVDAFGSCGFLASTAFFRKMRQPWFADINLIRDDLRMDEFHVATEFVMGQDLSFAVRAKEAGGRIICVPEMRMPHEEMKVV